jgi:dTDP-4-dehydrorhamnose reductase
VPGVTLLVIGASGYVGRHVALRALSLGLRVAGTYHRKPLDLPGVDWRQLDVTDADQVGAVIRSARPHAVISSAYAATPSLASVASRANWATNALGAVHVATSSADIGARLVHVSSDAVHSGRPEPLTEDALPDPVYPYGAAKAAAELGVALALPAAAIVRVSLINSDGHGSELSVRERFMLDLAGGRATGVLFTDDIRCPVAVTDVASALVELALGGPGGGSDAVGAFAGVLNVAGPDAVSYYDLGVMVAQRHGLDPAGLVPMPIAGSRRPGHVRLDTSLAATILRTRLRGVRELLG